MNCSETCQCENEATCSHISGRCFCKDGWLGSLCAQPACPPNQYGPDCSKICSCEKNNTQRYVPQHHELLLNLKEIQSSLMQISHLVSFKFIIDKQMDFIHFRCHPWTGKCMCKPGWAGPACNRACPFYRYGDKCSNYCSCKNGAFCDPVNGSCKCAPGMFRYYKIISPFMIANPIYPNLIFPV